MKILFYYIYIPLVHFKKYILDDRMHIAHTVYQTTLVSEGYIQSFNLQAELVPSSWSGIFILQND